MTEAVRAGMLHGSCIRRDGYARESGTGGDMAQKSQKKGTEPKKAPLTDVEVAVEARATQGSANHLANKVKKNVKEAVEQAVEEAQDGGAKAQFDAAEQAAKDAGDAVEAAEPGQIGGIEVSVTGKVDGEKTGKKFEVEPGEKKK